MSGVSPNKFLLDGVIQNLKLESTKTGVGDVFILTFIRPTLSMPKMTY